MKPGIYRTILSAGLGFLLMVSVLGQAIPDKISLSFRTGNAKDLSEYFNETIELVILDKEDVYSRQQAEMIVLDFFSNNKPTAFTIVHQGGKQPAQYAIGTLSTTKGNFRVYFLFKFLDGKPYIHQLRITPENE
jgi:hypothetical protein